MQHVLDDLKAERRSIASAMQNGGFTMELAQAAAAVQGAIAAVEAIMSEPERKRPEPRAVGEDGWPSGSP